MTSRCLQNAQRTRCRAAAESERPCRGTATTPARSGSARQNSRPSCQPSSRTSLTGPASAHYNQVNLGADYALSKRTSLYALFGYQKASGQTLSAAGSLIQANASVGDFGVSSNTNSQAIAVAGIRAKF